MIFGKTKMELKVGIFVFFGLILLVIFILSIGGFKTWSSGYNIKFAFSFINGVKIGAPVRFAGLDVGLVKRIDLEVPSGTNGQTKVLITCWLKREVRVPADSIIWVNTLGLLGEKYIEIMPGVNYGKVLSAGEELAGVDPLPMNKITDLANNIAYNINDILEKIKNKEGSLGKLIYDDTIYKDLEALSADLRQHPWKLLIKTK
ncbi:MAG: MlaD family protein [Candidatus Omnitrophota bacterium]|jgi:phospholipid/cholesterol/gamma-HCH transport system substrate-binding protein